MVEMVYPEMASPKRILLLGSMTDAFYEASDEERKTRILPRFKEIVDEWSQLGARVLASFDDDLFMVGDARSTGVTFYIICEVDPLEVVVAMIQRIRETVNGVRMDEYLRFEARVGRPLFLLESGC